MRNSNSTVINTAFNHTQPYFSVLEEVSKYNVQLNYFERLWAVRSHLIACLCQQMSLQCD